MGRTDWLGWRDEDVEVLIKKEDDTITWKAPAHWGLQK